MESKEIIEKVNNISINVNKELNDFYQSLNENVALNKAKAQSTKDKSRTVKPCPILEQIDPDMTESQRQIAGSTIANIEKIVKDNPNDFEGIDISDLGYTGGSKDSGDGTGKEVGLLSVGMPKWIQEIESSVKSRFKRKIRRSYFDVEALTRGITRKKKELGMKKTDYVYFLLDVSGSMSYSMFKGHTLLSLFASYVPPMAKRFDGLWLQVDGSNVIPTELSKIGKGEIKSLILGGGSGANFFSAIEFIKKDIADNMVGNPIIIIASDADEQFPELLPNTIFVTTNVGWDYGVLQKQGFPNKAIGQDAIIIDIDE